MPSVIFNGCYHVLDILPPRLLAWEAFLAGMMASFVALILFSFVILGLRRGRHAWRRLRRGAAYQQQPPDKPGALG